jgi:hypothetical protein
MAHRTIRTTVQAVKPDLSERGKLALGYARRGWKIFPISAGTKDQPRVRWGDAATNDLKTVQRWWERWPDDNIGFACGLSNVTVVDLDNKKGKAGTNEWTGLLLDHGYDGETLTSETPSGRQHLFFEGLARTCQRFAGSDGIDIRGGGGKGGYVLLPGSSYDPSEASIAKGERPGEYAWQDAGGPMLALPGWVAQKAEIRLQSDPEHDPDPLVELDQPRFQSWAVEFLTRDAAKAIEGRSGDETTYQVACTLRGRGLSEDAAFDLMWQHYNNRCEPPWTADDLKAKVKNAYKYANNRPGWETAEAQFDDEPPEIPEGRTGVRPQQRFLLLDDLLNLRPPEWMVKGLLPMNSVGVLYGASQTFKSFFAFHLAACCSVGIPAFKGKPSKKSEAFYVAAEGAHGFKLRAEAWIKRHNLRPESLRVLPASVYLDRENEAERLAADILAVATPDLPRLVIIDTLSANFTGKENTDEVAGFFRKCTLLAQKTQATVLVLHHTGKMARRKNAATIRFAQMRTSPSRLTVGETNSASL